MSEYSVGGVNRDMVGFYSLAEERAEMMMIAFITFKSSLVPLLEGL